MIREQTLRAREKLVSKLPTSGELLRGTLLERTVRHTKNCPKCARGERRSRETCRGALAARGHEGLRDQHTLRARVHHCSLLQQPFRSDRPSSRFTCCKRNIRSRPNVGPSNHIFAACFMGRRRRSGAARSGSETQHAGRRIRDLSRIGGRNWRGSRKRVAYF